MTSNAEAGIGLICACLPAVNAVLVRKMKGSTYYGYNSRSGHAEPDHGGIVLTRSFHVDTGSRSAKQIKGGAYEMGHDEEGLTADVQANPRSNSSSPGSCC